MKKFFSIPVFLCFLLFSASCTRNNAQRDFEQDAYMEPAGYTSAERPTELTSVDEDDWRTSPLFQGLVKVYPAYPNPVSTNEQFFLEIES